jgi:hypothetical protein
MEKRTVLSATRISSIMGIITSSMAIGTPSPREAIISLLET